MSQQGYSLNGLTSNIEKSIACALLIALVVASALAVIYSTYKSRQLFSALQREYRHEIELEEQWGRLLLEQSTWASPVRIEEVAKKKLAMKVPDPTAIRIVR
ncbi:cell division protein FtsL [Dasania sp. GY-MA-18]|uniref:Cell division protein FtsL n=1 Tax=Dasania phycosphaerae TaxID=2950436 RepID=A0A9J6RP96_9GAMM|nr:MULTISPECIES: cell division protein FtsL [Dasania]MCR8923695.1 cell division protein FtsL [Dasania sp. GY-MA-18]MCZ0866129.1 cell division protein FtsL [Dasania phycosphaerae]MCZ0869853.1 cell division protein FtsL [Dasania phycosphaerae]